MWLDKPAVLPHSGQTSILLLACKALNPSWSWRKCELQWEQTNFKLLGDHTAERFDSPSWSTSNIFTAQNTIYHCAYSGSKKCLGSFRKQERLPEEEPKAISTTGFFSEIQAAVSLFLFVLLLLQPRDGCDLAGRLYRFPCEHRSFKQRRKCWNMSVRNKASLFEDGPNNWTFGKEWGIPFLDQVELNKDSQSEGENCQTSTRDSKIDLHQRLMERLPGTSSRDESSNPNSQLWPSRGAEEPPIKPAESISRKNQHYRTPSAWLLIDYQKPD